MNIQIREARKQKLTEALNNYVTNPNEKNIAELKLRANNHYDFSLSRWSVEAAQTTGVYIKGQRGNRSQAMLEARMDESNKLFLRSVLDISKERKDLQKTLIVTFAEAIMAGTQSIITGNGTSVGTQIEEVVRDLFAKANELSPNRLYRLYSTETDKVLDELFAESEAAREVKATAPTSSNNTMLYVVVLLLAILFVQLTLLPKNATS